jgi:hypothetical protein
VSPTPTPEPLPDPGCAFCGHPSHVAGGCVSQIEWVPPGVDARHTTTIMAPCQCQVTSPQTILDRIPGWQQEAWEAYEDRSPLSSEEWHKLEPILGVIAPPPKAQHCMTCTCATEWEPDDEAVTVARVALDCFGVDLTRQGGARALLQRLHDKGWELARSDQPGSPGST